MAPNRRRGPSAKERAIVASAGSVRAAAQEIGVSRATVHRWLASGLASRPNRRQTAANVAELAAASPKSWADVLRQRYEFEPHEAEILALAERAWGIARDETQRPSVCLAAMGRFQQLVGALHLPDGDEGDEHGTTQTHRSDFRQWPSRAS